RGDGFCGDPGRGMPGGFGGFGGVFGEVAGDHPIANLAPAGDADLPDIDLLAPGYPPALRALRMRRGCEGDVGGGCVDSVLELARADNAGWWDDGGRV